jgi:hypothetical protein
MMSKSSQVVIVSIVGKPPRNRAAALTNRHRHNPQSASRQSSNSNLPPEQATFDLGLVRSTQNGCVPEDLYVMFHTKFARLIEL